MSKRNPAPAVAKLWKLALVAALAVAASTLPAPRKAEASPCTEACFDAYVACRDACAENCPTRVPCYSNCVNNCLTTKNYCLAHC
jgi:hypothetical protein